MDENDRIFQSRKLSVSNSISFRITHVSNPHIYVSCEVNERKPFWREGKKSSRERKNSETPDKFRGLPSILKNEIRVIFNLVNGYFQRRWKNRLDGWERKRRWAGTVTQKEINTPNERRHTEGLQKGIFDGQMDLCCIEKERGLSARSKDSRWSRKVAISKRIGRSMGWKSRLTKLTKWLPRSCDSWRVRPPSSWLLIFQFNRRFI